MPASNGVQTHWLNLVTGDRSRGTEQKNVILNFFEAKCSYIKHELIRCQFQTLLLTKQKANKNNYYEQSVQVIKYYKKKTNGTYCFMRTW